MLLIAARDDLDRLSQRIARQLEVRLHVDPHVSGDPKAVLERVHQAVEVVLGQQVQQRANVHEDGEVDGDQVDEERLAELDQAVVLQTDELILLVHLEAHRFHVHGRRDAA